MIKKNTLVLLVVMLLLVGGYLLLKKNESLDFLTKPEEATATPMPNFISLDPAQVEKVALQKPAEDEVVLTKQPDGSWQINVPGGAVTAGNIEEMVSEFNAIKTTALLNIDLDGQSTGLDEPRYTFTIASSGGGKKTVKIGNTNPMGSSYYAQVDLDPVVLISTGGIDNILQLFQTAAVPPTATPVPLEMPAPILIPTPAATTAP